MFFLHPDSISDDELEVLEGLVWSMPDGDLREAVAYMHDALAKGNAVVVGAVEIEERP